MILNKVDIYLGSSYDKYTLALLDDVILLLINEPKIDNYLIILEEKLVNLDANISQWEYEQKENASFIGMYHYLGKNHSLIKTIPQPIKDFYLKDNKSEFRVVLDANKSHLLDTHWTDSSCQVETYLNQEREPVFRYHKKDYHFTAENKIDITQNWYTDEECKNIEKDSKDKFYVRYKEISVDDNRSNLYGIRIEEFANWVDSFDEFKQKDAYFTFEENKLCFSKSIFVKAIETTSFDDNGNAFTSTYSGIHIQENESDEVNYKNCMVSIK